MTKRYLLTESVVETTKNRTKKLDVEFLLWYNTNVMLYVGVR